MRKILFSFLALSALMFAGCQETEPGMAPGGGGDEGGSYVGKESFELSISIPGTRANAYTTIAPVRTESDIYSLHLVFFERTLDGSGAYKGIYSVDIDPSSPLDIINPVDVNLDEAGLTNTEAYNVLLVANLDWFLKGMDIDQWKSRLTTMNEVNARDFTRAYVEGEPDETVYSDGLRCLPMSATATKEALVSRVSATLERTVARIDVLSYVGTSYDLVSASIWNGFPYSSIWEGDVDYNDARIQRYYGLLTEQGSNGRYEMIQGGLYTFENYVETPADYDKKTTCVIIGMRDLDPSSSAYNITLYYRINIHSTDSPQDIKRNNSYNLTVRGVLDKGYPTELEAYLGETDKLDIVINYWDLDDDGMIMYDGDNILAVPMKRINIPRSGDEREYSIFTLGNGTLQISRNTLPAGITARLDGNMLYVDSDPLSSQETSRGGEIDLMFGTLKATVIINQSGDHTGEFIELSPASLPLFSAYGATTSETITVNASGAWTAKLYNEGFSFAPGSVVKEFSSAQGDSFTVSTTGSNPENSSRVGFLIVSLDDNADVNRSIVVQQRGQSGLKVTPDVDRITFKAQQVTWYDEPDTFTVDPGDNGYGVTNPWTVEFDDDTHFYLSNYVYDPNNIANNTFTVATRSENTTLYERKTNMRVYITDEPAVCKEFLVIQTAHIFTVSPQEFNPVPAAGGTVGPVNVGGSLGMAWSASVTTSTDTQGHSAVLVDEQGREATSIRGTLQGNFYVKFPRLDTPNISPVATVTVVLDGTERVHRFTVTQSNLVPRALHVNSKGTSHATLVPSKSNYKNVNVFGNNLFNSSYFGSGTNSVVKTAGTITNGYGYDKVLDSKITTFFANQDCHSYIPSVVEWMNRDHRNFLIVNGSNDHSKQQQLLRNFSGSYTLSSASVAAKVKRSLSDTPSNYRNSKVWQYLVKDGPFTNGVEINVNNTAFYSYTSTTYSLSSWPSTMIPVIMHPTKSNMAIVGLDPVNRILVMDPELFCDRNSLSNFSVNSDNWKFLNNLLAFVVNASMYGDDFLNEFR